MTFHFFRHPWFCSVLATVALLPFPAAAAVVPLDFTVTLSRAVNVDTTGGTPRIELNVGGVQRYATYASGSGSTALVFTYTPAAGDLDLNGIGMVSPIQLNSGTIADTSGNPATLTYTPPATTGIRINYPSLSLDMIGDRYTFGTGVYTSLSSFLSASGGSFSRASVATYYNSSGILQTAASGTPRLDYNPVTGVLKGILIEEARTNLVPRSQELDHSYWAKSRVSVTANAAVAPDGTMTAELVVPNTENNFHSLARSYSFASGPYTLGGYFKAAGNRYLQLNIGNINNGAVFDLQNGTISGGSGTRMINAGNGWYHCSATITNATAGNSLEFVSRNNTGIYGFTGNGTSGTYMWGLQVERAAFPSSYIPTVATSALREADVLTIPSGSWLGTTQGVLSIEAMNAFSVSAAPLASVYNSAAPADNQVSILRNAAATLDGQVTSGAASQATLNMSANGNNLTNKASIAYALNSFGAATNGVLATADTSGSVPVGLNTLGIGSAGTSYFNGHLRKLQYYPSRSEDAQLQLLTQ